MIIKSFYVIHKLEGLVNSKNENSVIQSKCRSKPLRLSFIFGTQIKIVLMKSESF